MGRDGRLHKPSQDWSDRTAPDLAAFEAIAQAALGALPETFRALCDGIVIRISDFPDMETLDALNIDTPYGLLGLFEGEGLAQAGATGWTGRMPNRIHLYRRPIIDYWAEYDDTLGAIITHVLVHEIGHHFGLSDDDMERIELASD